MLEVVSGSSLFGAQAAARVGFWRALDAVLGIIGLAASVAPATLALLISWYSLQRLCLCRVSSSWIASKFEFTTHFSPGYLKYYHKGPVSTNSNLITLQAHHFTNTACASPFISQRWLARGSVLFPAELGSWQARVVLDSICWILVSARGHLLRFLLHIANSSKVHILARVFNPFLQHWRDLAETTH